MATTYIHLSDIHFGQEKGGTVVTHNDVKARLIDDVRKVTGRYPNRESTESSSPVTSRTLENPMNTRMRLVGSINWQLQQVVLSRQFKSSLEITMSTAPVSLISSDRRLGTSQIKGSKS